VRPPDGFSISAENPCELVLHGELDVASYARLDAVLADAIVRGGPILIDVSDLTFIDARGVRCFIEAANALSAGAVVVYGARGVVLKVLELTGVGDAERLEVVPGAVTAS
jgi:anti-sigma B factor antagonist